MEMINTCKTPTHMCVQELHIILEATYRVHIITQMHVFLSPVVTSEQGFNLYCPHAIRKKVNPLKNKTSEMLYYNNMPPPVLSLSQPDMVSMI